jgi:hypothetical protein
MTVESRRMLAMMFRALMVMLAFCDEVGSGGVAGTRGNDVAAGVSVQSAPERAGLTISMPYRAEAAISRSMRRSGSPGRTSSA